jgi:hypothetical protein
LIRLLLDIHVAPAVVAGLRAQGVDAISLRDWRGGTFEIVEMTIFSPPPKQKAEF